MPVISALGKPRQEVQEWEGAYVVGLYARKRKKKNASVTLCVEVGRSVTRSHWVAQACLEQPCSPA